MTEDDGHFLSRWSRRKAEIARAEQAESEARKTEDLAADGAADATAEEDPPFDLSVLPKIENITGDTDIRLFMHKAVPEDLRNAALRRSWEVTESIRDYLDPAREYAWDWNTPGANPGGPLEAGYQAARLAAQMLGGTTDQPDNTLVVDSSKPLAATEASPAPQAGVIAAPQEDESESASAGLPADPLRLSVANAESFPSDSPQAEAGPQAVQTVAFHEVAASQQIRRRHGGATPA